MASPRGEGALVPAGAPPRPAHLLLGELDLVQLLHVLLVVLLLQLADEELLLLEVARVLLRRVLLELHGRLRVQGRHDLLPATSENTQPSDRRPRLAAKENVLTADFYLSRHEGTEPGMPSHQHVSQAQMIDSRKDTGPLTFH